MHGILLAAVLALSAPASPGSEAAAFRRVGIEPIVQPADYRRFLQELELGKDEIGAADMLFEDYEYAMRSLLAELQATQEQERARLDAALRGEIRLSGPDLRALRVSLRTAASDACDVADGKIEEMTSFASILSPLDDAAKEAAIGAFHRRVYLSGADREALVDVTAVIPEGVLSAAAANGAIDSYQKALSQRARSDALAVRRARFGDGIASINQDSGERKAHQASISRLWCERMVIHDALLKAVEGSSDPPVWRRHVDAALFPSVYGRGEGRLVAEWIAKNGSADQASATIACTAATERRLAELRREAVALLREGRAAGVDLDHDAAALVEGVAMLRMQYLRNSGERSVLEQELMDCLLRPLSDGQRAAVRRVLRADPR